jgi:phosphatidylglycerol---prolipoprotein diacylglyceryl transferase
MFPYISDLINYLFGTSLSITVPTFGFILVIAIIMAFLVVYLEIKRKEQAGLIPSGSAGNIFVFVNIVLLSVLVGAKLFHILDHWDRFIQAPFGMLFSPNGHSFYGGLTLTVIVMFFYLRHIGLPMRHGMDIAAPAILLGSAVGRWACQLAGDGCWGIVNPTSKPGWLSFLPDWMWRFTYPHNTIDAGITIPGCAGVHCFVLPEPVFPTPVYESAMAFLSFCIIWLIRKRIKTPGHLFSCFLILYGLSRFLAEMIRINPKFSMLGMQLSQAQMISFILFISGFFSLWCFRWFQTMSEKKHESGD